MYWPKFSKRKLVRLLETSKTPAGVSCAYVKWTKHVGLKMYSKRSECDDSWRRQRIAQRAGLAPRAGEQFSFAVLTTASCDYDAPELEVRTIYCYWTEHAVVSSRLAAWRKVERLRAGLAKIGIVHNDLAPRNYGLVRGKLVVIDFDSASCGVARGCSCSACRGAA